MLFTELVLQGVRRFDQMFRLPIGVGFSAFVGGPGSGKSTIVDVLVHLLFPEGTDTATDAYRSGSSAACRVALSIDDGKGQAYRLVKDLLRGSMALTRHDASSGQFVPVSSTPAEILQFLSSTIHLPQRDLFEGLYVCRQADLPSCARGGPAGGGFGAGAGFAGQAGGDFGEQLGAGMPPGAMIGGARGGAGAPARRLPPSPHFGGDGGGGGPSFPGYRGEMGAEAIDGVLPDDPSEIRAQIETLERDISAARQVDELQFRLDGLQSELFEVEQRFKGVREAQARVDGLQAELDKFSSLAQLPGDFESRVRDYEQSESRFLRDRERLDKELQEWQDKERRSAPGPLGKRRDFLGGLGIAVGALAIGAAGFFTFELLRWVALADILGFGIVLVAVFRHIDQSMFLERSRKRIEMIDERKKKLVREFELETSIVKRTMDQAGVDRPRALLEQYGKRAKVQQQVDEAEKALARARTQGDQLQAESRKKELQAEIDRIEADLSGSAGMMMSVNEMERKLDALQDKMSRIESGSTGVDPYGMGVGSPPGALAGGSGFGRDPGMDFGYGMPAGAVGGAGMAGASDAAAAAACLKVLDLARDLFILDTERLASLLQIRASQYVAALTSQAYTQVVLSARGIGCTSAATGSTVAFEELPSAMQDLVYLGLRFTIIEIFSRQQAVPVFLDDPFSGLPPGAIDLLGRMLAVLGRGTQVILFSSQSSLASHATRSAQL